MRLGNQINDTIFKMNKSKSDLDSIHSATNTIINEKLKLESNLHSCLFKYESKYILDLMEITDATKIHIITSIPNVCIYTVKNVLDEKFVIRYFVNKDEYEFNIIISNKRSDPIVLVYENGIKKQIYDMKLEFIALDFEKIRLNKFLENYIDLLIKNKKDYKLGMIILAYQYLIEYKRKKYRISSLKRS